MKRIFVLVLLCALFICSCKYKADVQCMCNGNGKYDSWDFGIQHEPDIHVNTARCDTLGSHENLDTCNLFMSGN